MHRFVFLLLALCVGCGPKTQQAVTESPANNPFNGSWELVRLRGAALDETQLPKGPPALEFNLQESRYSGSSGCNRIGGTVALQGEAGVTLLPGLSTKMLCPGSIEPQFLAALYAVSQYRFEKDQLVLLDADLAELLRFRRK